MQIITDFSQLSREITSCLKPKLRTNCTLSAEKMKQLIERRQLFCECYDGGLLLLEKRRTDHLLRYYLTDPDVLPPQLPENVTAEVVCRPGEPDAPCSWWEQIGFRRKIKRLRLLHPAAEAEQLPPPESVSDLAALALLRECFDETTGCIPTEEETSLAAREGRLLPRFSDGRLVAALHAEQAKGAVELRHLAVLPEYRGKGFAGSLTEEFVRRFGGKRLRVWVREDLPQARHIYEKNDFTPDGYTASVWQTERK